ncbi:MAG: cysteine--tRNA ligase [Holosporales bacterium]|jgi:cysteinyl-tRNA synthetase|nr:cysteine--tRNA ligase [Holosporales bacterium]
MNIILYNSLSRQKEVFSPLDDAGAAGPVRMYVCGPTVYDFAHLGNARAMVVFDVLFRLLRHSYEKVIYVRNITDIDDKIYAASVEKKCHFSEIAKKFEIEFVTDMNMLNVCSPTYRPRATEFIPQMISMISTLIDKGFAYEAQGHVLYEVDKYPEYGKLSKKSPEELLAGARVEIATYKKSPGDFVLWKPSTGHIPGWESPWGYGRPGWHIECSAMSAHYLGEYFDIHAGGIDLIFPHHENERAQSCGASGQPEMARFWLHNGHLMINGQKMSKSLGNFFTVRELLGKHPAEVVRLTLISTHYRQPLDWTYQLTIMAQQQLNKWYRILGKKDIYNDLFDDAHASALDEDFAKTDVLESAPGEDPVFAKNMDKINELSQDFLSALCDDLNTPLAIQHLNKMVQAYDQLPTDDLYISIFYCGRMLGILYNSPASWFQSDSIAAVDVELINQKIEDRKKAKQNKDYERADDIRRELLELGVILEDTEEGTSWRKQ